MEEQIMDRHIEPVLATDDAKQVERPLANEWVCPHCEWVGHILQLENLVVTPAFCPKCGINPETNWGASKAVHGDQAKPRTVDKIGKELLDALSQLSPAVSDLRKEDLVYITVSVHRLEVRDCIRLARQLGEDPQVWENTGSCGIQVNSEEEVRFSLYFK